MKNGDAFNLEKEAKIINPHQMDLATTAGTHFKGHTIEPKAKVFRAFQDEGKPILAQSSYMKAFPNW